MNYDVKERNIDVKNKIYHKILISKRHNEVEYSNFYRNLYVINKNDDKILISKRHYDVKTLNFEVMIKKRNQILKCRKKSDVKISILTSKFKIELIVKTPFYRESFFKRIHINLLAGVKNLAVLHRL